MSKDVYGALGKVLIVVVVMVIPITIVYVDAQGETIHEGDPKPVRWEGSINVSPMNVPGGMHVITDPHGQKFLLVVTSTGTSVIPYSLPNPTHVESLKDKGEDLEER